jgi:PAS domain S-box-containing protein
VIGPLTARPWGWSFHPGPGLFVAQGVSLSVVVSSCFVIRRATAGASRAATLQRPWLWLAIASPTVTILLTDVVLPAASIPFPRLGAASMAITGGIVCWTVFHYGLSLMTSPRFGDQMLETLDDGVALVNVDGTIRSANRSLVRLSGYPVAALTGMRLGELFGADLRSPAEAEEMRRDLVQASGRRIPVSVSIRVLRERQHNEVGMVVVLRDLRELEEMRRISLTNARLAAVGELAAGLAHEINNPIAFVGTNLRLLRDHWERLAKSPDGSLSTADREGLAGEGRDLLAESIEGVERAAEIVRGVKNFTHSGSAERMPARLAELIEDCLRMLRPQLTPGVQFELEFGELPEVLCAPQELKQVILNLAINAMHAVAGQGVIRIATRREGALAVLSVADDGCGIPPEVIDRIFDPFFTTKPVGEGTGLGLGIAHQVVTRHGGVITVTSEPGTGATFRVHLPLGGGGDADAASPG